MRKCLYKIVLEYLLLLLLVTLKYFFQHYWVFYERLPKNWLHVCAKIRVREKYISAYHWQVLKGKIAQIPYKKRNNNQRICARSFIPIRTHPQYFSFLEKYLKSRCKNKWEGGKRVFFGSYVHLSLNKDFFTWKGKHLSVYWTADYRYREAQNISGNDHILLLQNSHILRHEIYRKITTVPSHK